MKESKMKISYSLKALAFIGILLFSGCSKNNKKSDASISSSKEESSSQITSLSDYSSSPTSSEEILPLSQIDISANNDCDLEIGVLDDDGNINWQKDFAIIETQGIGVTFGELTSDGELATTYAYGYPEAGQQTGTDYTTGWAQINPSEGFYQFDLYLRASSNNVLLEKDVYISNINIQNNSYEDEMDEIIDEATRIHIHNEKGNNHLISKYRISENDPLPLFGKLDLDDDGVNDIYNVYPWDSHYGQEVIYGINGETQVTKGINDIVQARDAESKMPTTANEKLICTTSTSSISKITVTVWLEIWSLLQSTRYVSERNFNLSLTLDTGK